MVFFYTYVPSSVQLNIFLRRFLSGFGIWADSLTTDIELIVYVFVIENRQLWNRRKKQQQRRTKLEYGICKSYR